MKMECSTGRHRKPSPPADQRCGIPRAHHRPLRTPSLPPILPAGLAGLTGNQDALGEHGRPRRLVTPQTTGSNPVRIASMGPKCCGVTRLPCTQENWVELPVDPPMGTWPSGIYLYVSRITAGDTEKAPGSQPGKRPPPYRIVHWTMLPLLTSFDCGWGPVVRPPVSAPNAEGASLGGATVCKSVAKDGNGVRFPASAPTSGRSAVW